MARDQLQIQRRKLYPRGGSFSLNLPVSWLTRHGISGEIEIVDTPEGILVRRPGDVLQSIEDEPEFARFLAFLAKDTLANPETLVKPETVLDGIDSLLDGVEPL